MRHIKQITVHCNYNITPISYIGNSDDMANSQLLKPFYRTYFNKCINFEDCRLIFL